MQLRKLLPPTYLYLAISLIVALHVLVPGTQVILSPWRYLGILPLILGTTLNIMADQAFKRHQTTVKPYEESTYLMTDGVFRLHRRWWRHRLSGRRRARLHAGGAITAASAATGDEEADQASHYPVAHLCCHCFLPPGPTASDRSLTRPHNESVRWGCAPRRSVPCRWCRAVLPDGPNRRS